MSDFRARIKALLDKSEIPKQIKSIEENKISFKNVSINTKSLISKIQNSLNKHTFTINLGEIKTSGFAQQIGSSGSKAGKDFSKNLLKTINDGISNNKFDFSVAKLNSRFSNLNTFVPSSNPHLLAAKDELEQLAILQNKFKLAQTPDELVSTYEKFNQSLSKTKNNLSMAELAGKSFTNSLKISTLDNKIEIWSKKNTAANKQWGASLKDLRTRLSQLDPYSEGASAKLQQIEQDFISIKNQAMAAGKVGKTFGSSIMGAFKSISRYVSVSTLIFTGLGTLKQGISNIIALDDALVDLQKTTDGTNAQLEKFYYTSNETAKKLGVTTKDVIQSTADWSRLGYSLKDAEIMAETSAIFKSISPGMTIDSATDGLVSAMKAFDIEANDALDGIASKINAIGNTQAVNNDDIVNVLTRSSSAMKEANNTLEETIALGTAATEITRDAESVGTSLKTKFYINCLYVQKCA